MDGLPGRNVVVTGGGRGVGAATCRLLARYGARVTVGDTNAENAKRVAESLTDAGCEASFEIFDVADESAAAAAIASAVDRYGPLGGVVNAAATMVAIPLEDMTGNQWAHVMSVNVAGVFNMCKHSVRRFLEQGTGGSIVNVASISGQVGLPQQAAYCASKGAVLMLTKQIAADYAPSGIRCNAVSPGSIEGEFLQAYLSSRPDPASSAQEIVRAHPIARLASAEEIAGPIAFLLSDLASFVVGANLQVDGGYTAV